MDIEFVRNLAKLLNEESLNVIEVKEEGEFAIRLEKHAQQALSVAPEVAPQKATPQTETTKESPTASSEATQILSPMVGVFYASPSPGAKPYVSVGSKVKEGDVLCIIKAMKLMKELTAEQAGTMEEILEKNEDVVEYNQPLFRIVAGDNE